MNRFFEYCRFTTTPRHLLNNAQNIKTAFAGRAQASGGHLFGCWRSLVGLGLARDEGIALTSWPDQAAAQAATPPDHDEIFSSKTQSLEATVRPTDDTPPAYNGVYVFRWFDITEPDWPAFRDISDAAWPNMEDVFDVNICGFWRGLETPAPAAKVLLLTRYADLSVWEASRWWSNPAAQAEASMSRFKKRNEMIDATVAYPSLLIGNDAV